MYVEEDYQFLSHKKMYSDKYVHAKKIQYLRLITLFQSNEGNVCERRLSIFVMFHKNVSRQVLPCQKVSVFETEHTFFNQRMEMNVKEVYEYQFLSHVKKCIPTKFPCQTISVSEIEYIFFNQRKEMFVKKGYHFLSTFIKMYPDKYISDKKIQRLKWNTLFSIKGT